MEHRAYPFIFDEILGSRLQIHPFGERQTRPIRLAKFMTRASTLGIKFLESLTLFAIPG
ncbi:MAG: hypothetical protein JSR91_18235 [Proteobacteria bacterium]|nr:hypothetical protein [Pseudomonadota bacterium]